MSPSQSTPVRSQRDSYARGDPGPSDNPHHNWIAVLLVVGVGFMSFVLVSMMAH
jgi:uncharacterized membrane protein (DUF4010 family)